MTDAEWIERLLTVIREDVLLLGSAAGPPTCEEDVTGEVICDQGTAHYRRCGAHAVALEREYGDHGGSTWAPKCLGHLGGVMDAVPLTREGLE